MHDCLICNRIHQIKDNTNRYFVTELQSGYVVIGDFQFYKGYTIFLSKYHVQELHELDASVKNLFLQEMSLVAEAVYKAFSPNKLNYELLGNTDAHLHWHIFPRKKIDPLPHTAIWAVDKKIRSAEQTRPSKEELTILKSKLLTEIQKLI